jgi:hypothetical protein
VVSGPTKLSKPESLELISAQSAPGGGELIFFKGGEIKIGSTLTPIRIWFDNGSTTSCISKSYAQANAILVSKGQLKSGQGVVGQVILEDIASVKVCFSQSSPMVTIQAYCIESPIFQHCDLLIGADHLGMGKPLGLHIGFKGPPKLLFNPKYALESSNLEKMEISAHACSNVGNADTGIVRHTFRSPKFSFAEIAGSSEIDLIESQSHGDHINSSCTLMDVESIPIQSETLKD